MPNPIISSILNASQFRVYDDRNGDQVWKSLGIISVNADSEAATSQKPLSLTQLSESDTFDKLQGTDIEASKIIRPTYLKVVGLVPDITTAESIISAWENVFLTFTVMSRGVIADNMTVSNVLIEQLPEHVSADKITIEFEQVEAPSIAGFRPSQDADKSSIGLRIQTPSSVLDTAVSIYNRVTSFIRNF